MSTASAYRLSAHSLLLPLLLLLLLAQAATQAQCCEAFEENDSTLQLHKFLKADVAERVLAAITAADKSDNLGYMEASDYSAGIRGNWRPVGPPHRHRCACFFNSLFNNLNMRNC
jgi:Oxoglutarate and iron-dependent oxygenase degradation C-term